MARRRLVWILLVAAVVILLGWMMRPRPVRVELVAAEPQELAVTLDEEGETRVRDRYVVSAPVAGRVQRIELETGDPLVANTTVLAIFLPAEPTPLDARSATTARARVSAMEAGVERARAALEQARSEFAFATVELERHRALVESAVEPQRQLDVAAAEAEARGAAVAALEAAVTAARSRLAEAHAALIEPASRMDGEGALMLRSPVDGVVLQRFRESESVVPAGEPLLSVGDPRDLEVVSDFLSTDAVRIRPGHKVFIEQWGGDEPLHGRVRRVEPFGFTKVSALGVEEQRVAVRIDFTDSPEAWENLGDGYRVGVRVVVWADVVLAVPTSSLFRRHGAWEVFVVEKGEARRRQVEVGHRNALAAEIVAGLAEGERVIAYPSDEVGEGAAVAERPRPEW